MAAPREPEPRPGAVLDRRGFVALCAAALTGALAGACASLVVRPVTPVDGRIELPLARYPELLEPGGSLKLLPDGAAAPVYVLALGDGRFSALSPICTHQGCTVDIQGARLVCPCHGSTYVRRGAVLRGPAPAALQAYDVAVQPGGVLVIDLEGGR